MPNQQYRVLLAQVRKLRRIFSHELLILEHAITKLELDEQIDPHDTKKALKMSIDNFIDYCQDIIADNSFRNRIKSFLKFRVGCRTVAEVVKLSATDLRQFGNCGMVTITMIEGALGKINLRLNDQPNPQFSRRLKKRTERQLKQYIAEYDEPL